MAKRISVHLRGSTVIPLVCLLLFAFAVFRAGAQGNASVNPHPAGQVAIPKGSSEIAACMKCHTQGCPMPHPEKVPVTWPIRGSVNLINGAVTCGSCHTPGFRHRSDAFLARDQKGLCSNCHYGTHALPNAHPFGTPCASCHVGAKELLVVGKPVAKQMVDPISAECLRCHYDGPITHPIGVKNSKIAAPDLPLGHDGTITCVTCHYGHSSQDVNGQLLRKNNKRGALCLSCHNDL